MEAQPKVFWDFLHASDTAVQALPYLHRATLRRRGQAQKGTKRIPKNQAIESVSKRRPRVADSMMCSVVLMPLTAISGSRFQIAFSTLGANLSGSVFVRTAKLFA